MNPRFWLGVALLLASATAFAAGPLAVRKQIEASMLVTGTIEVDPEGRVERFQFDQSEKLPSGVIGLLQRAIPDWRFEPVLVDGKAVRTGTDFSARVIGRKANETSYEISIGGVAFGGRSGKPSERPQSLSLTPPAYPTIAAQAGVAGNVYLLVRVDRDGRVTDAFAEQVNLKIVSDENTMERWRDVLTRAAIRATPRWRFQLPTEGPDARKEDWVVRVPVMFNLDRPKPYGSWDAYVRGPRQRNPWHEDNEGLAFAPDALPDGQPYPIGSGLKMTTPLSTN